MEDIILSQENPAGMTLVSNAFIDYYMASANGSFVKVYLYLLRCLTSDHPSFSISYLADRLLDTEKDIKRALMYWEQEGLLSLVKREDGTISNIIINTPKKDITYQQDAGSINETVCAAPQSSDSATVYTLNSSREEQKPRQPFPVHERPTYTETQIAELTNTDEVKWLLNIIEIYLERLLKPTDLQLILYLYETLGFSAELIMHLYDYCVSRNKKNPSYIETVALAWAEQGIDTVEKAEMSIANYNESYSAVNKAFGLNRSPGHIEKQFIDKWLTSYQFNIDIISEACSRTLLHTGKPDFKYADKILENWKKHKVKNKADIKQLDEAHNNRAATKKTNAAPAAKTTGNRFNAFPQRNYSSSDYSVLEQKLLNK